MEGGEALDQPKKRPDDFADLESDVADVGISDEILDLGEEVTDAGAGSIDSGIGVADMGAGLDDRTLADMGAELADEIRQEEMQREIALARAGDRVDQPIHTRESARRDYNLRRDEVLTAEFNMAQMGISPDFDKGIHDKIFGGLREGGEVRIVKATDPGTGDVVPDRFAIIKSQPIDVERLNKTEGAERLGSG